MSSIQSFYFVGVITLVSSAHVYGQKKDKMNVLFIIADDMRPELGCYGIEDIVTPHIDRLAEQATVFQNAYCNIPVSGASRASLFTGVYPCYPERFTAFDANAEKDCPKALSLPECFKKNGCYVFPRNHVHPNASHDLLISLLSYSLPIPSVQVHQVLNRSAHLCNSHMHNNRVLPLAEKPHPLLS